MKIIAKLSLSIILCLLISYNLFSVDIHVGPSQTYSTIQDAVDAATSGDVIIIHEGTYSEEVRIGTDNITITANGTDSVIVNGCEPLLTWTNEGNGVYSTTMDWDVTEGDQTNQIFVDGKMMNLTRWPNQTNDDFVMNPVTARMENAIEIEAELGEIIDHEFDSASSSLWDSAMAWVNLSNPECKRDGQGWSGPVYIVDGKARVKAGKRYGKCDNYYINTGSRYYLFNPTSYAVKTNGGVTALLSNGEWWKDGNELYVKLPDGGVPASSLGGNNLVEAKKYPYAFRPDSNSTFSNVTIKKLNLFATSITTDDNYFNRTSIAGASNNIFDQLNIKYITHSYDCSGNWQYQWNGRSGIILSGTNNILKNSKIVYSSASAVSLGGKGNKVINCFIHEINYNVHECGAINSGVDRSVSVDHIIAYNTIYNTTHAGVSTRNLNAADDHVTRGVARIHHNVFHDCLARAHDLGVIDGGQGKNGLRIDHNIIYDSPEFLQIGIYFDYGENIPSSNWRPVDAIVDHNVIYNVWRPIQPNSCSDLQIYNNTLSSSGNSVIDGVHLQDKDVFIQNNIGKPASFGSLAVIDHNISTSTAKDNNYFTDHANGDFTLTANATSAIDQGTDVSPYNGLLNGSPDIGAYEYGKPKWEAGATTDTITLYNLSLSSNYGNVYPGNGPVKKGEIVPVVAEEIPGVKFEHWGAGLSGTDKRIEVTMDSSITANAVFSSIDTYNLEIIARNGSVSIVPDQSAYNEGTEVTLTPIPNSGYEFSEWTGDTTDSAEIVTITMNSDKTITANFDITEGIKDNFSDYGINLYPNPNSGENLNLTIENLNGSVNIQIYHLTGTKLYDKSFKNSHISIPFELLGITQNGGYIVQISVNNKIFRDLLIINKK